MYEAPCASCEMGDGTLADSFLVLRFSFLVNMELKREGALCLLPLLSQALHGHVSTAQAGVAEAAASGVEDGGNAAEELMYLQVGGVVIAS